MKEKDIIVRKRHKIIYWILYPFVKLFCHLYYPGLTIEAREWDRDGQYVVVYNHQTPMDQFFISIIMGRPVYHIATEDIFSNGLLSRLMVWAAGPIPIKKQMKDVQAVRDCLNVIKQGGTLALAPEGNRTCDGRTTHIGDGSGKLVKKLKCPLVCVKLRGGYGVEPRWSGKKRRGKLDVRVERVITPEEMQDMSAEDLSNTIKEVLWNDESAPDGNEYTGANLAEYMERLFYVCPVCGFGHITSQGNRVLCRKCGLGVTYTKEKALEDPDEKFPFENIGQWADYQRALVNKINPADYEDLPIFTDRVSATIIEVKKRKTPLLKQGRLMLYGNRAELADAEGNIIRTFNFAEADVVTALGRKKINIYCGGEVIQLAGDERFNGLKYVNMFYRYQNYYGGMQGDEFLGL